MRTDDIYRVILNNEVGLPVKVLFSGDREPAIKIFNDRIKTSKVSLITSDVVMGIFGQKQDKIEPEK